VAKAEEARLAARVAADLATATVAVWREEAAREETARAVAARAAARAAVARVEGRAMAVRAAGKSEAMAEAMVVEMLVATAVVREVAAREVVERAKEMAAAMAAAMAAGAIEVGLRLLLQIGERVELLQIGLSWVEVHANHFGGALVSLRRVVDGFCIGGVDPKVEDAPARPEDAPKACDELVVTCERRERKPGVGDKDELRNRASDGRRTQLDRVQLVLLRLWPPTSRPSP
jgi:hypothetical protein